MFLVPCIQTIYICHKKLEFEYYPIKVHISFFKAVELNLIDMNGTTFIFFPFKKVEMSLLLFVRK